MRYRSARELPLNVVESLPSVIPSDAMPSIDATKFAMTYGRGDPGKRSGRPYAVSAPAGSPVAESLRT
jgi:hypothetical protein